MDGTSMKKETIGLMIDYWRLSIEKRLKSQSLQYQTQKTLS
jgi:hypothetical protein